MEEIKVGEYIRTREPYGEIFKVVGIGEKDVLVTDSYENNLMATDWVAKHSPNIIDLIEENDYVNGYPVRKINGVLCNFDLNNMKWTPLKEIDVWGDIATHEQFNSIKYEVE